MRFEPDVLDEILGIDHLGFDPARDDARKKGRLNSRACGFTWAHAELRSDVEQKTLENGRNSLVRVDRLDPVDDLP